MDLISSHPTSQPASKHGSKQPKAASLPASQQRSNQTKASSQPASHSVSGA